MGYRTVRRSTILAKQINAPARTVWNILTDIAGYGDLLAGGATVEMLTDGPYGAGTRWRETRTILGFPVTTEAWVAEAVPGKSTTFASIMAGAETALEFTLEENAEGTLLTARFAAEVVKGAPISKAVVALFGAPGLALVRRSLGADLDRLAAKAEGRPLPAAHNTEPGHSTVLVRRIDAPVESVWAVLTDIPGSAQTLSGITRVEMLTEGPYDAGTRWRETRTMMGKSETVEMWVSEVVPLRSTTIKALQGGADYTTVFALAPVGSGTLLTMTFGAQIVDSTTAARIMMGLFGKIGLSITRKALAKDLADIAAKAESLA
jgi:carbon monoxide dehydrogenase subunit G